MMHFLTFAYLTHADFYIIIAGNSTINLPKAPNLHYLIAKNINLDYGGYSQAISSGWIETSNYQYFIFINSSVRGPYLPSYYEKDWTSPFLEPLYDEDIGLVGSSINILPPNAGVALNYLQRHKIQGPPPLSHVQTTVFAMRGETVRMLQNEGFFSEKSKMEKDQVIEDYEIHLTQKILSFGFNIKCLLPEYNTIDYRNGHEDINPHSDCGDPLSYKRYFGRTVHPYEGIFVKTNRALYDIDYLDSLSASMLIPSLPSKSLLESSPVLKLYVKKLQQINCTKKQNSRFSMRILRWAEKKITRSICRDLS